MSASIANISQDRQRLRVTGADRAAFLHGQCTNDIKRLMPGDSCYAAFLNAKGKMRGEGHIICRQDDFILEVNDGLQASLEKFVITEDVTIEDVSGEWRSYLVIGSGSLEGHASSWPRITNDADATERVPPDAIRFAHPLGTGVLSPTPLPVTLDAAALDVFRIEAGIPKWGVDMDENTIPVEAGLAPRAISYEKGCYIGQETIARIKTYGHVNRQLVQLSVAGDQPPVNGAKILAGESEVGRVTSAARSNRLGKVLALGYVRREFAVTGTQVSIGNQSAEVLKIV